MTRLVWGDPDKRLYETGVDRGVFYPQDGVGVPWNGLIAVSEAPSGADILEGYYDGSKFRQQRQSESFEAKLTAYTYPKEFRGYDGLAEVGHAQQRRRPFNLSYRTRVGNDESRDFSYLIHLVYNAVASPSSPSFSSIGTGVDAVPFEWNITTIPDFLPSGEAASHVIVNPQIAYPWAVKQLEDLLYGSPDSESRFPTMHEIVQLFEDTSILRITDHGDGTWTADGPDEVIQMLTADMFEITWPSAVYIDSTTYRISSL